MPLNDARRCLSTQKSTNQVHINDLPGLLHGEIYRRPKPSNPCTVDKATKRVAGFGDRVIEDRRDVLWRSYIALAVRKIPAELLG